MSAATMILLAAACGVFAGFFIHVFIARPLCEVCGAKALPNQTRALIREGRRADKLEEALLSIAQSSSLEVATLRALAWQAIRENER